MRLAEGESLLDQIVRHIGGQGETAERSLAQTVLAKDDLWQHCFQHAQHSLHRVYGIEQRLLVFLQITVVRERETFENREHSEQVAIHPPGLAADQLRDIGILFLRHHRAASGKSLRQFNKAELATRPQY